MRRFSPRVISFFTLGLLSGILICKLIPLTSRNDCSGLTSSYVRTGKMQMAVRNGISIPKRSNIYLGMMSAEKFLTSRVQRNINTWLQKGGWKVEVFADADPSVLKVPKGLDINVVTLPTVDDLAYPPQKKSFLLLRHMYDNHINNFDWFIRSDDDSYTDYPRLEKLLNKINSSLPIFLGNPGFGMDADDGIEEGMKYLMGGLGMIFSRGMLIQLRPHLKYCIQHLFSPHEDIEIGRCVWKHTKNSITPTAWETIDLFYQQYEKETGAVVDIKMEQLTRKRTQKTITYHSVKTAELMHKLHKQILNRNLESLLNRTAKIRNEIAHMKLMLELHMKSLKGIQSQQVPLLFVENTEKISSNLEDNPWPEDACWFPRNASLNKLAFEIPWLFLDKYYRYDVRDPIVPVRGHSKVEKKSMGDMQVDIEEVLIPQSCPKFPPNLQFSYGYMQYGLQDGVRVMTVHRSSSGSKIKYCRTFSQISYGVTLFMEEIPLANNSALKRSVRSEGGIWRMLGVRDDDARPNQVNEDHPLYLAHDLGMNLDFSKQSIIFVIPLQGRYRALEQFMESYEKNFLIPRQNKNLDEFDLDVQLAIVLLGNDEEGDDLGLNRASAHLLRSYQSTYGSALIRYHVAATGDRSFSRGAGIQLGSLIGEQNDILFFMDIDMVVTPNLAKQCHAISQKGTVAWYPIPYSQYDPDRLCFHDEFVHGLNQMNDLVYGEGAGPVAKDDKSQEKQLIRESIRRTPLTLSTDRGFWRDFGFGIACMYKSDFIKTGGFDLTIEGWGEEDIRLFVSLIKSGMDVFRARQSDLVHIFHPKQCDSDINEEQRKACLRTKASHFASQRCLANTWFQKTSGIVQ